MALALDSVDGGANAAANSLTFAHTNTGSNLALYVGVTVNGGTGDNVTCAYNSVSMTKDKVVNVGGQFAYIFSLINPATGTHNVVVSDSETPSALRGQGVSYTGAKQSGQPDASASNTANPGTTITDAVTVIASGCWIFSVVGNDGALAETPAGVLTTARGNQNQVLYVGDSNGIVGTGSQNATWTSGSQVLASCAVSIAPVPSLANAVDYAFFL